jgi:hypothetical protein
MGMELFQAIFSFIRVGLSYYLLFGVLPLAVIRWDDEDRGFLSKLFIGLIHANVFFIIGVHLLLLVHLYETISIYFMIIGGIILVRRFYRQRSMISTESILGRIFDAADDWGDWIKLLRTKTIDVGKHIVQALMSLWLTYKERPFIWTGIIIILTVGLIIRLMHAMEHQYYASSDPYVHLQWANLLSENNIYSDGVYPYGFEVILSVLSRVFILDLYSIIRFFGPFTGLLLFLSILYFVKENLKREYQIAMLAIAVYVATMGLPVNVWRQLSALPMEYGAIFLLPGIHFLVKYFRTEQRKHLILAAEVLMLTVFIHPFTAMAMGVSYVAIALLHVDKWLRPAAFLRLAGFMAAAGLIGVLPIMVGLVLGKQFHSVSLTYLNSSIQIPAAGSAPTEGLMAVLGYINTNPGIITFLICAFLAIVYLLLSRHTDKRMGLSLLATAIVLFICMKSKQLGLPSLMPEDRAGVMFSVIAAVVIAFPLRLLNVRWMSAKSQYISKSVLCSAALLLVVYYGDFKTPVGNRYQYDQAAQHVELFKKNYIFLDWTVISPVEEAPMIRGYGWHYNLWEFVSVVSDWENSAKPEFKTSHVFFFVEKLPLRSGNANDPTLVPISSTMAARPFPKPEGNNLTDFFYRTPDTRALLEAKMNEWAEGYMKKYKDMDVFYEDEAFKVYRWTNPDKKVLKLNY